MHSHGERAGGSEHELVTTEEAGFMSAADKAKLDSLKNQGTTLIQAVEVAVPPPAPEDVESQSANSGVSGIYAYSDHQHDIDIETADLTDWGTTTPAVLDAHIAASSDVHGVGATSNVVGTQTTQGLYNKTLFDPTIGASSWTNANHDHEAGTGGGQLDHDAALTNVGTLTHAQLETNLTAAEGDIDDLEALIGSGSSFPGSPSDGDLYYHTTHDEWFKYDGTRSHWLSQTVYTYNAGNTQSVTNGYLKLDNNEAMGSAVGHWMPYDMTLVGASWNKKTRPESQTLEFRADGVSQGTVTTTNPTYGGKDMTLDIDFAEDELLGVYVNGTQTDGLYVTMYLRRRET